MLSRHLQVSRRTIGTLVVLMLAFVCHARASATLLLEEPYGKLGFFTPTGHSAVYLSNVCAEPPLVLRRCEAGELGIVISRYNGVAGYDWIAIPLIPYLYAVERTGDIPLFADAKMVAFLRDRYRRKYLADFAPDKNGETPGGNWYELVGSSYDRTIYGFEIETTPEQDDALIRKYNAAPNRSHFRTVSRNCADFVRDVINFYYPKALRRSVISDIGISTPKQMAKRLLKFSERHPELQFSRIVIPQVPGSVPRSTAVQGVVEAFFKSKKYIVPSVIVSPIFAGCVAAVYLGTGPGHFDPARNAMVFSPGEEPELPLGRGDRRTYQRELESLLAEAHPETSGSHVEKAWGRLQSKATADFDGNGQPVLQMQVDEQMVSVGVSAGNVLSSDAPPELVQHLLQARLQAELRRSEPPSISGREMARDWRLLQQAMDLNDPQVAASPQRPLQASMTSAERADGN